jgi:hypothetical protein
MDGCEATERPLVPTAHAAVRARICRCEVDADVYEDVLVSPMIEPPNSVLLVVGREEFTPPQTFAGSACAATSDCIAVGVLSVDDGPTAVSLTLVPGQADLVLLGEFLIESEGHVSLRDVYNREYDTVGVDPGTVLISVLANDVSEPSEVTFLVAKG